MKISWKKATVVIAVAGALLLTTAAVVVSQRLRGGERPGFGFHGGPGRHEGLGPMAHDLNLTDDQKAQVKKITDDFEATTKDLHEQMRLMHQNETDPMSGAFDEAAVRAAAEARAKVGVELDVAHARMMSQIAGVLTAEQKAKVAARRQQFKREGPPREDRFNK